MSTDPPTGGEANGRAVYGLRVYGLDHVEELPRPGRAYPHEVRVEVRQDPGPPPEPVNVDDRRSVRRLADGRSLALERPSGRATFYGEPLAADLLAHPYLGPVATVFNRWAGREVFHAGVFVLDGRAWAVVGPRTAGKSTLLAALAARDVPVLSDDILVVDRGLAYAGPRCLDLREPVPSMAAQPRSARGGTRWRVMLPPVPAQVPLGGWFFLRWGTASRVTPVTASRLLPRLAAGRAWGRLPSDPTDLLALATLPAWDLTRPRNWARLGDSCRLVRHSVLRSGRHRTDVAVP